MLQILNATVGMLLAEIANVNVFFNKICCVAIDMSGVEILATVKG
mgnify:CR=1 FL=1|jgi:hypothetical protein